MATPVEQPLCQMFKSQSDRDKSCESKVPVFGFLVFEDECSVDHTFPLERQNFTIGREKGAHLRLMTAITSRVHCVITCDPNGPPTLFNKSSLNRTYVNDSLIETSTKLTDGATIKIGQHVFKFKAVETSSVQDDTLACESTLDEVCDEPEKKPQELEKEEKVDEEVKLSGKATEKLEAKREVKSRKIIGRNIKSKTASKMSKEPEEEEESGESSDSEKVDVIMKDLIEAHLKDIRNENEIAGPSGENQDVSGPDSASEDKCDEDEDVSISASANEEKTNDEVPSSPLKHRSKNNLKVTFKAAKEEAKKSQSVNSDAVRRSTRRRQNNPTQVVESTTEPAERLEPEDTKTKRSTRRKKNATEVEEPTKEEKIAQEENKRPKRGRKPKLEDDSIPIVAPTRKLRSRK